jgi:hypothetical protein
MSPLRWDVLLVGFALALPVLALGLRGDLSTEEMMTRVLWCLGAGWAAVAVIRLASTPRAATDPEKKGAEGSHQSSPPDSEPTPAS